MSDLKHRYIGELSDGERQRAMIARILAQDTGLMIMDEPTAFLDIGSKYEILHLLHNLAKDYGKTIIFSSHDFQIAITQADKIWLITDCGLIEGSPEDLMLGGDFDHILSSTSVKYNSDHGTFSFPSEGKGSIWVEGEGIIRHWTEQALNRAGFSISESKTFPWLIVPDSDSAYWRLVSENNAREFNSIYELITTLTDPE
jgi:iron complex transport system ATP-binding protein